MSVSAAPDGTESCDLPKKKLTRGESGLIKRSQRDGTCGPIKRSHWGGIRCRELDLREVLVAFNVTGNCL